MTPELVSASRRLVEIAAHLRNDIDTHRLIALNIAILKKANLPHQFVAHSQRNALIMIVMGIRKAFDRPTKGQDMHSIPAVIRLMEEPRYDGKAPAKMVAAQEFALEFGLADSGSTAGEM